MNKILYIKANIKPEGKSRTFQIADSFIEEYKANNPFDEITTLDLYDEKINFLQPEDLASVFGPKDESSVNHPILKYAYQFVQADKIIIAAPMWNLNIPAILKAYIDYITVTGITFKYTATGPVGLCTGKKALHVVTRGGAYSEGMAANFEMGDKYLKTIFAFFGITDFTTIAAENLDVMGFDVDGEMNKAITEAKALAKTF